MNRRNESRPPTGADESKAQPPANLWNNRWQVIRMHRGAVTVLCAHRWEWAARSCAAWRDVRIDMGTFGSPVRIWHEHRPTPRRYAPGGRIR